MTNNGNTYRHVNRIIKILILWCLFVLSPSVFCQEHSFVDSLYSKQIQSLNLNIDLPYNQILAANINQQIQQRSETATKLGIFFTYSVLIDSCLTANNLPSEFRYIPLAVSNMNNGYQDKYQRKGVWALPYAWAVKEQLLINDTIDERLDIGKATFIAIKRLKTIYFQDENIWHAIIAYANSIQNLNNTINRIDKDTFNIWDIYHIGTLVNKNIIPDLITNAYLANYYHFHHIIPKVQKVEAMDTVFLQKSCSQAHFLNMLCIDRSLFTKLNPCIVSQQLPCTYPIYLPKNKLERFRQVEDSLYMEYQPDTALSATDSTLTDSTVSTKDSIYTITATPTATHVASSQLVVNPVYHTVKSGDVLGKIAQKYGTTVSKIMTWNNLKNDKIYIGQKLIVGSKESKNSSNKNNQKPNNSTTITYTVKSGDTLSQIAKKYGTSIDKIKKSNHLSSDKINIGQKLKIEK